MNIEDIDTSRFLYDPKDEKSWKELKRFKEFKEHTTSLKTIVPYIIFMYDPANKELDRDYPYLPQRKMKVAEMVGMVSKGRVPKHIEEILIGKNTQVNAMIVRYLELSGNPDISMLATYKEIYSALNKSAMEGEHSQQLIKSIDLVNETIKDLQERILKGKDETDLRAELYITIEGKGLGLRVEDIAEKLLKGEDIFPEANPYGNYKPQKLKFVDDK
jgi:hypothetical protein